VRVGDRSTLPHILVKKNPLKRGLHCIINSYKLQVMKKQDKINLLILSVFFGAILTLVIYNIMTIGIARYPYDGI
jgi:hypothetical protein